MKQSIINKICIAVTVMSLVWVVLTSSPLTFKPSTVVTISKGDSVKIVAQKLKQNHIIQSEIFFTNMVIFLKLDSKIVAGDYEGAANEMNGTPWQRQTPVRVADFQAALRVLTPKNCGGGTPPLGGQADRG